MKKTSQPEETNSHIVGPLYGASAYLPPKPSGEDDNATGKHITALQVEYKSKNPNMDRVNLLMKRTLHDRKKKIVEQAVSVQQIATEYPWLSSSEQLLQEYERITDKDIKKNVSEFLQEYAGETVVLFRGVKKYKENFINTIISTEGPGMADADKKYGIECTALMAISVLLGEDVLDFVGSTVVEPRSAPAFIKCDMDETFQMQDVFQLHVDGQQLCQVADFITAYSCFVACFYVFNLQYISKMSRTICMLLMDKIVAKLQLSAEF
jgi:hypothetical protein